VLDRANIVTFSAADSLNVDGSTTGLTYTWKYTSKNSNQKTFTYKFDELGCFPVDLTVRSQKNGKVSSMRSYIKIENIPPKMSGLTILPNDLKADPVIVKVSANNARDEDGVIVSYLWYYYTDTDPEPQDFRISRLPSTTFVLPKISGKYFFAVSIEDSNGAKINSEEISEERYSLTLASDNINTPIITLKTSNTAIFVGESTSFSVATKNILGTDISDKCEYKWDFDGDGFYDETTTAPKTTHVYNSPGTFSFKVKATYKGMSNTKYQQIIVRNELKPQFDYVAVGDKLMLFNTTKGFYTQATWDLGGGISSTNLDAFSYDFTDSTFPSSVTLTVSDGDKATQAVSLPVRKDIVNKLRVEKKEGQLVYFTYPKAENDTVHLATPDQKLFVYLGESKGNIKKYAIDTNVDIDSDLDGIKDNDADNAGTDSERKGLTFAIKSWDSKTKQRTVRLALYGEGNKLIESKDLQVILDFANESSTSSGALDVKKNANIADEDKIVIEEIKNEITPLASSIRPKMMDYLAQLQDSWNDEREKTKTIIDFEAYIEQNLSAQKPLQEKLFSQLESLLVSQKNNKDKISIAAQVLKNLAKPSASYDIIVKKMDEILSHPNDIVKNKSLGQEILKMIETDTNIPSEDKVIIKSQLQEIIYSGAPAGTQVPVVTQSSGGSSGIFDIVMGFVKILGYVLLGLVGLLLVIFVYYKISKKNENLSFQDFLIEKFLGGTSETITSTSGPTPAPQKAPDLSRPEVKESPAPAPVIEQMAPEAPVPIAPIQEDIAQSEAVTATDTSTDNQDVPDWLKNSSSTYVAPEVTNAPTVEATVEQSAPPASDIPDWLKGGEMFATPTPESSKNDDIPDWLKGMNTEEINAEVEETLAPVTPVVGTPQSNSFAEIAAEPTTQSTISNDDDIPEWLKQNSDESSQPVAEA
jgi:cytoskeletal protein RodZ